MTDNRIAAIGIALLAIAIWIAVTEDQDDNFQFLIYCIFIFASCFFITRGMNFSGVCQTIPGKTGGQIYHEGQLYIVEKSEITICEVGR